MEFERLRLLFGDLAFVGIAKTGSSRDWIDRPFPDVRALRYPTSDIETIRQDLDVKTFLAGMD